MAGLLPDKVAEKVIQTADTDRLAAVHLAIEMVKRGGTISLSGVYGGMASPMPLLAGDGDPLGVDTFSTHRVPLAEAPQAYTTFQKRRTAPPRSSSSRNAGGRGVYPPPMATAPLDSLERLAERLALPSALERKRMLIIVNPYATTVSDRLRNLVVYALQGRYDVEAIDTQRRDHATELCREAAQEGYDVVVSFGGDGTANEAANGLLGSRTPLTCLPGGATNVLCKMLGIPGEIVDATEHLLRLADDWRPRPIDLATVNGRVFTFGAGIGLDASVVKRVDAKPALKSSMRQWYFAYAGVDEFLRRYVVRPPRLELSVPDGGAPLRGVTAVIQNGDPMTYFKAHPLRAAEGATLFNGVLAGIMLERASPLDVPTVIHRLFSTRRRLVDHRRISSFSGATEVIVRSADGREVPLQVDGDHIADVTEARFGVLPGAIDVLA